jgi:TRAP-type C4-dicarboxylate transport system permease small subunit
MNGLTAGTAAGKLLEAACLACRFLAILLLGLMSILVVAQVIGRNFFDVGMPWADELSRFCGVALVFLGAPMLALRGQQVAVDMVPTLLPAAGRRLFIIVAEVMVLLFSAVIIWSLYAFLSRAWKFATPTLGIPNWIYYTPAAICFVLLAMIAVAKLVALLRGNDNGAGEGPHS